MIPLLEDEIKRYNRYIDKMELAIVILKTDLPSFQKNKMLEEMNMDMKTFEQKDYLMLEWAITREIRSFKHALNNNYYENNTNSSSNKSLKIIR